MVKKPKNSETMVPSAEKLINAMESEMNSVIPSFSETAYGLFKNKETGEWVVTEIAYDPNTLQVKNEVKLIPSGDNTRAVGEERFRITVGRRIFSRMSNG